VVSARYHLVTVMSVFLALGLGILLGGSLGQQWLSEKQQGLIDQLERHYDEQVTQNRELSASLNKVQKAYRKEKDKTDELLRLTVGDALSDRYFVVYSSDHRQAKRLKKMIEWAGGHARTLDSLTYTQDDVDAVVLMGDSYLDQVNRDVLRDLQLLYGAPIVVHTTTEAAREWQGARIYPYNGSLSEVLSEYKFLKFLQEVIPPPLKEDRHAT